MLDIIYLENSILVLHLDKAHWDKDFKLSYIKILSQNKNIMRNINDYLWWDRPPSKRTVTGLNGLETATPNCYLNRNCQTA